MPVYCSHCGKELLRESARFCSHCGTVLPLLSSSQQQESQGTAALLLENTDKRKSVLHEQIAQQPFSHSASQPVAVQAIVMTPRVASPITPLPATSLPVSEPLSGQKIPPLDVIKMNTAIQNERETLLVVRENTPRPTTIPLPPLVDIEKRRREIGDALTRANVNKSSSPAQLTLNAQPRSDSLLAANHIKHLSKVEIISILIIFLILSGGLIWFLYISSTNDPITNPMQNFNDTHLGISLQYPNKWIEASDSIQHMLSFYDNSNHTTQIKVGMYGADIDIAQFMQEQALQFGMTNGQFGMPMSFGNASWRQLRGHLVENGADYVGVISATMHNYHLYMIAQFAPQGIYATEDKLIFTPFCMSFHFLQP